MLWMMTDALAHCAAGTVSGGKMAFNVPALTACLWVTP